MGRIVLHKHYDSAANITADKFFNGGELIISNEIGNEGIYILNTRGDVVKIGYNGGSESGGTIPSGDYITAQDLRDYLHNQAYMTSADTAELLSAIETAISELNDRVDNIPSAITPTSGGVIDLSDLYEKVGTLSATTEEHIGQNTEKFQSIDERIDALSGLTAEILTEEQVKDIVIGEISFLVASADTMFDALRGLADWIANDETGSAQLIADVNNVKHAVSGVTDRVSVNEENIDALNSDVADIADNVLELSGSVVEHITQNEADLQELNDKIEAIEIPEIPDIPEPVSDEHIRDIAAQEVASLVSSADSMYQVLQELAEWVENDESGSAQLINDVAALKDSVSGLTNDLADTNDRVSDVEGCVGTLENAVSGLSEMLNRHILENREDLQDLSDRIDEIEIPEIPEPVSDEHIQDIAAQEVAKLVSSADSMYQVLQELADWVENDESGSAQLISDVANLNDGLDELSGSVVTNQENINELSAETESLKNLVENLPIPSGSPVDESVIQALKDYIDEKIASIQYESDHVFLSRAEYSQLITEGHAMIDGKMHYFSNSVYYCIYQGSPEPPTPSGETIDYEISGDTINFNNGTVDEDGFLNIGDITLDGDFIDLNAVTPIIPDEPDEPGQPEEPDTEPVVSGDTMSLANATVDDEGFVNAPSLDINSIIE